MKWLLPHGWRQSKVAFLGTISGPTFVMGTSFRQISIHFGPREAEKELEKLGLCPEEITKIIDSSIGKYLEKRTLIEAK